MVYHFGGRANMGAAAIFSTVECAAAGPSRCSTDLFRTCPWALLDVDRSEYAAPPGAPGDRTVTCMSQAGFHSP